MALYATDNFFYPVQFSEIGMMLASDIKKQYSRSNDCSPEQWIDIDMMLASICVLTGICYLNKVKK